MMTGFQAEENLTGRAPKKCAKNSGRYREVKRRSSVIGIFPNEESLVRTMGAVLMEESHQRQSGRALFSPKTFKEFMTPEVIKTLIEIANEQQRVMAA